jgi:hypothetical protein
MLGLLIGALMFGSAAVGAKVATHDLNVNGAVHATGDVTGDTGLLTTLGGVDTNYVNINNPNGGVRWQYEQMLSGSYDPNSPPSLPCGPCGPAYAPAGSIYLRHVDAAHGELWFDTGSAWVKVAG